MAFVIKIVSNRPNTSPWIRYYGNGEWYKDRYDPAVSSSKTRPQAERIKRGIPKKNIDKLRGKWKRPVVVSRGTDISTREIEMLYNKFIEDMMIATGLTKPTLKKHFRSIILKRYLSNKG